MEQYYLAIDIGASNGRHILGHMSDGRMVLEEIYRFPNGIVTKDGQSCWEIDRLEQEIKLGMIRCRAEGKIPVSVAIDTWGVDFVLLDAQGKRLGNTVSYRDGRTQGMDHSVYDLVIEEELYHRTGIQKQIFNTIYQLMALQKKNPKLLNKAEAMLMIPDYFNYRLTGKKVTEYTNATTTQLINPRTKDWDQALIQRLSYPQKIFQPIHTPGTVLGTLTDEVIKEIGYDCKVVLPATHDTGSAVVAVPSTKEDTLYLSSGTWSLMGTERKRADCSMISKEHNFTNEGGYEGRYRYLKNIMGLFLIQSVRKEIGAGLEYGEICEMAAREQIPSIIDCNDQRFLAPKNMTEEIRNACRESGQQVPATLAQIAAVIYNSLAICYRKTVEELEQITGKHYDQIHIVGGGANASYLNELTAKKTGRTVYAGPIEATAIGNLAVQMIADGKFASLKEARETIFTSFEIQEFRP